MTELSDTRHQRQGHHVGHEREPRLLPLSRGLLAPNVITERNVSTDWEGIISRRQLAGDHPISAVVVVVAGGCVQPPLPTSPRTRSGEAGWVDRRAFWGALTTNGRHFGDSHIAQTNGFSCMCLSSHGGGVGVGVESGKGADV